MGVPDGLILDPQFDLLSLEVTSWTVKLIQLKGRQFAEANAAIWREDNILLEFLRIMF